MNDFNVPKVNFTRCLTVESVLLGYNLCFKFQLIITVVS